MKVYNSMFEIEGYIASELDKGTIIPDDTIFYISNFDDFGKMLYSKYIQRLGNTIRTFSYSGRIVIKLAKYANSPLYKAING